MNRLWNDCQKHQVSQLQTRKAAQTASQWSKVTGFTFSVTLHSPDSIGVTRQLRDSHLRHLQ